MESRTATRIPRMWKHVSSKSDYIGGQTEDVKEGRGSNSAALELVTCSTYRGHRILESFHEFGSSPFVRGIERFVQEPIANGERYR